MTYQGKNYLGEIIDARYDDGFYRLTVRHMNGELWKDNQGKDFFPSAMSVDILS